MAKPDSFAKRGAEASYQIGVLTEYEEVLPLMRPVITTLRKTVEGYYSENVHRGLALHFALQDLDKLESLWPAEKEKPEAKDEGENPLERF
ncbi:MAG: hypothetical protein K0Q55_1216 [Verrucomicrobia bacterium]|nr:hypothetical protein [Verrucomicrobiota bacterium]